MADKPLDPRNHRVYKVKAMHNANLVTLCELIDRGIVEELLSISAVTPDFREADKKRVESYFEAWEKLANFMSSDPELDTPQSHPEKVPVGWISNQDGITDEDGEFQAMNQYPENFAVRTLVRDMRTLMGELAMSTSRRLPNGLSKHDKKRFDDHLAKMRKFMSEYVQQTEPLDRPETDTIAAVSGHGSL